MLFMINPKAFDDPDRELIHQLLTSAILTFFVSVLDMVLFLVWGLYG